ncbi:MAG: hypothetical protein R3Y11_01705 [Pseudomonadota bacterium]
MAEFTLDTAESVIEIGATGINSIMQNIRSIVMTRTHSVPLDRAFAHDGAFIDSPSPLAVARSIALLTSAIETYEPRVSVVSIEYPSAKNTTAAIMDGQLYPKISFTLADGVSL